MIKTRLEESMIETIKSAAKKLSGAKRRAFQAEVTKKYCGGRARVAERQFGWRRVAVQKGLDEMETGIIVPNKKRTGRPSYSQRLPNLQNDIRSLVDPNSQTHPTFAEFISYRHFVTRG